MGEAADESVRDVKISGDMDVNLKIAILTEQMKLAAEELRFEDAAALRDKIKSLESKIK